MKRYGFGTLQIQDEVGTVPPDNLIFVLPSNQSGYLIRKIIPTFVPDNTVAQSTSITNRAIYLNLSIVNGVDLSDKNADVFISPFDGTTRGVDRQTLLYQQDFVFADNPTPTGNPGVQEIDLTTSPGRVVSIVLSGAVSNNVFVPFFVFGNRKLTVIGDVLQMPDLQKTPYGTMR